MSFFMVFQQAQKRGFRGALLHFTNQATPTMITVAPIIPTLASRPMIGIARLFSFFTRLMIPITQPVV